MKRKPIFFACTLILTVGAALLGVNYQLNHPPLSAANKEFRAAVAGADNVVTTQIICADAACASRKIYESKLNAAQTRELIEHLRFIEFDGIVHLTQKPYYETHLTWMHGNYKLFERSWAQAGGQSYLYAFQPATNYKVNPRFEKSLEAFQKRVLPPNAAQRRPAALIESQTRLNWDSMLIQPAPYPATSKTDTVHDYFGTRVSDPYSWLEDDRAPATEAWGEAQNEVTFDYLNRIPFRDDLRKRLGEIYDYPKYSAPSKKQDLYFFNKNEGLQNQSVLWVQRGLEGTPEVLIDANTLSEDGTTRLGGFAPSKDARYAAYMLNQSGSDWQQIKVMDLQTRKDLADVIDWVKISGMAWQGDGFYYSRYDAPENQDKAYSAVNEFHKVYFHRVGTPQSEDELIYQDKNPENAGRFHSAGTTKDQRFVILSISDRGKGHDGNQIWVRDNQSADKTFVPITDDSFEFRSGVVGNIGGKLLVETNRGAANERVVLVDPNNPAEENWQTIIPETDDPIVSVSQVGGKLIVTTSVDVSHRVKVYDETGKFENEIELPTLGSVGGFGGEKDDTEVFYTFTSFAYPPTIYRYNIADKTSQVFRKPEIEIDPANYETRQVFYASKDGTKIPMFVVNRKGLKLDGTNPTLLYAYGGFNISLNPGFNPLLTAWLEQGGVYAVANLRGGGEYGEAWHKAGMKLGKQNVFDDFIAAAEYLKTSGYTSTEKLAIQGGSNGGLLVGAVMAQRPDLCKVALPAVGVMDMLRYHRFTIGYNWAAEYGSADENAETFRNLYAYSPLHNLKAGVNYPATLVTTADHDDRVVPAHSFKFAATLQAANAGENPVLIRIETKSGHGSSNTSKALDATADVYAFALYNLGVKPKF